MLAPGDVTVTVRSGSIAETLVFQIVGGEISCNGSVEKAKDCFVHFSIPPSKWWDNVRLACSTIQIFATEAEAKEWPGKYGFLEGEYMDLGALWRLSKAWYHDKHRYEYTRKTPNEVFELFEELGMSSSYWKS
ncbi:hypothetical protein LOZ58_000630 [Ophidiomyces ophidiicola]|nr:hypothetical protein LOZ65_001641 [Ophidiomyces ophidiicola]KAI1967133.1 hypothetical protein LOZ58_000630 [Ophidiomyces ophidiicola]